MIRYMYFHKYIGKKIKTPRRQNKPVIFFSVKRYWPVIDDALRRAAFDRRVNVSLLISYWNHTWEDMPKYLKSLAEMRFYGYPKININVVSFDCWWYSVRFFNCYTVLAQYCLLLTNSDDICQILKTLIFLSNGILWIKRSYTNNESCS